jgi:hypothetical protein
MKLTIPQMPNRRRIKLINPRFQVGLMIKFILANTVILAVCGLGLHAFLRGEIEANLHSAHAVYRSVGDMLSPIIVTLTLLSWGILSLATVVVILYTSHRIAGPLYRFQRALGEMEGRNLTALTRIREDDQLGELAINLQQVRDIWADDIARLRCLSDELGALLPAADEDEATQRKLAEIRSVLDAYPKQG